MAGSGRRVLVVDDDPGIVAALELHLRAAGFEVAVARDGDEALTEVERFAPRVVLLDVMLPGRDGYEVLQRLRDPASPSGAAAAAVVLVSAKARDTEVAKGLAMGAAAYLTKPFPAAELLATVAALAGEEP